MESYEDARSEKYKTTDEGHHYVGTAELLRHVFIQYTVYFSTFWSNITERRKEDIKE
jgi:hypothetical protein